VIRLRTPREATREIAEVTGRSVRLSRHGSRDWPAGIEHDSHVPRLAAGSARAHRGYGVGSLLRAGTWSAGAL